MSSSTSTTKKYELNELEISDLNCSDINISESAKLQRSASVKLSTERQTFNLNRSKSIHSIQYSLSSTPAISINETEDYTEEEDTDRDNSTITLTNISPIIQDEEPDEERITEVPPSYEEITRKDGIYGTSFSSLTLSSGSGSIISPRSSSQVSHILGMNSNQFKGRTRSVIEESIIVSDMITGNNSNTRLWTNPINDDSASLSSIHGDPQNEEINKSKLDVESQTTKNGKLSDFIFWAVSCFLIIGAVGLSVAVGIVINR